MEEKVYILGVILFIYFLFNKLYLWDKLSEIGSKARFKTVYKLLNCQFCIMFHINWFVCVALWGFSFKAISTVFVVYGFFNLLISRR